jgi:YVTN family beta-propeller protein
MKQGLRRTLFSAVLVLGFVSLLISGCSSNAVTDAVTPGGSSSTVVSGTASKGPIGGGTVNVVALKADGSQGALLGTATTNPDGSYSISVGSYTGSVLVVVSGGTYKDEATNTVVTNTATFRAAVSDATGTVSASVTPFTELAVQNAGTLTTANITASNNQVSTMLGGVNILTTKPVDVSGSSSGASQAEKDYGLMLAALSQMANTSGKSIADLVSDIKNDLSDGKLDTTGAVLNTSLATFLTSSNNHSGMTASDTHVGDSIATYIPPILDTVAPDAPTGLTATAASSTGINLAWTKSSDNVGVTGYRVYRDSVNAKTVTDVTMSDTGLTAATKYCYTISAIDAASNESAKSTEACATTTTAAVIPAPTITSFTPSSGAQGTAVTITGTNFSATGSSNTVKFNGGIQASVTSASATQLVVTLPETATTGKITVTVGGQTATSAMDFTVTNAGAGSNISATATTTAQNLTVGTAMASFSPLTASGGATPYTYSVTGTLPAGLSLNTSTGAVTGTPTAVYAAANLVFSVKDVNNVVAGTTSTVSFTVGAASVHNRAYVVNTGSNNLSVIDTTTNTVVATVNLYTSGVQSIKVAVNPAANRVYVTRSNGAVSVINTTTNAVVAGVVVGTTPIGVAVNPAANRAYVANTGSNNVSVIDTTTNTVVATVVVGTTPIGVAVNPAANRAYVANIGGNNVSVIDTTTNTVVATVAVGSMPEAIAVDPAANRAYVANYISGTVSVIDTTTDTVVATVAVGATDGIAVNPAANRLYLIVRGFAGATGTVTVIDTTTNAVVATVAVGINPTEIAVNPAANRAYVTNNASGNVSVIDTTSNTVVATVAVGNAPDGVAVIP